MIHFTTLQPREGFEESDLGRRFAAKENEGSADSQAKNVYEKQRYDL